MTKEEILKKVAEENVQFIRLQFTDILGVMKNISITADQLEKALDGELMFDGSSIEGFVRIEESDMYLKPDPNTFLILPWINNAKGKTARMICDIFDPDNEPFEGSPVMPCKKPWLKLKKWVTRCMLDRNRNFLCFSWMKTDSLH